MDNSKTIGIVTITPMLAVIIFCLTWLSCNNEDGVIDIKKESFYAIKIIDSCEYIEYSYLTGADVGLYSLTHKGNCKFCKQRNK